MRNDIVILDDKSPVTMAKMFVAQHPHFKYWQDVAHDWNGRIYQEVDKGAVNKMTYEFIERCVVMVQKKVNGKPVEGEIEPMRVRANKNTADELIRAIKAETYRPTHEPQFSDCNIVAFANGLFDLRENT
jgi:hypothetical protein